MKKFPEFFFWHVFSKTTVPSLEDTPNALGIWTVFKLVRAHQNFACTVEPVCTRRNVQKWNTERTPKGKREKEEHLQEGGYLSKFQDHCPLSSRRQRHLILIINTWPPCLHSPVALQKLREDSQYLQSCHLVTFWTLLGFNDWIFRLLNPVQLLNWYNVKHLTFWSF